MQNAEFASGNVNLPPRVQRMIRQNMPAAEQRPFNPEGQPDEWIINYIREKAHRFGIPLQDYIDRLAGAVTIRGIPVTMNSFSGVFTANNTPQLVIDQNFNRLRFTVANPDTNSFSFYLLFKNVPQAPIPLSPGQTYVEEAENPIIDQVWLTTIAGIGEQFTAYEGVPSI